MSSLLENKRVSAEDLAEAWTESEPKRRSDLMCYVFPFFYVFGIVGLLAFLLIVLEWTRPSLPSPLRPICDLRVLNHFIKEAQDAEVAMVSVKGGKSKREVLRCQRFGAR